MFAAITSEQHFQISPKTGLARVRVDIYLDPTDPMYFSQHVHLPNRPLTEDELASLANSEGLIYDVDLTAFVDDNIGWYEQDNPVWCIWVQLLADATIEDITDVADELMSACREGCRISAAERLDDFDAKFIPSSHKRPWKTGQRINQDSKLLVVKRQPGTPLVNGGKREDKWTEKMVGKVCAKLVGVMIDEATPAKGK